MDIIVMVMVMVVIGVAGGLGADPVTGAAVIVIKIEGGSFGPFLTSRGESLLRSSTSSNHQCDFREIQSRIGSGRVHVIRTAGTPGMAERAWTT